MSRIAVLHNTLDFQGGADRVCLEACRALQDNHDLTLFTISDTSLPALAARFDVDLGPVDVRMPPGARTIAGLLSGMARWIGPQLALRSVLLRAFVRSRLSGFDLAVSTANELSLPIPSVQYIHYPQFNQDGQSGVADGGRFNRFWSKLAGPETPAGEGPMTLLANSSFTAAAIEERYGARPAVLYPPVDPISCDRRWSEREQGIVVVGRIAPDKRLRDAISVVDAVREQGMDVHLHIAGSAPRAYRGYVNGVRAAARERPYVTVETDVSRARIETLLCTHRVGLNLKEREPFGMAVAEYLAAGMVPIAPASGGQQEILEDRSDLTFSGLSEAIDLVVRAFERDDPPALETDRFAPARFREGLRQHVKRTIDSSTG